MDTAATTPRFVSLTHFWRTMMGMVSRCWYRHLRDPALHAVWQLEM